MPTGNIKNFGSMDSKCLRESSISGITELFKKSQGSVLIYGHIQQSRGLEFSASNT